MVTPRATDKRLGPLTFAHSNGWTLSVAHNIGGVGYSIVAYPTVDEEWTEERGFVFEGDSKEAWVGSLSSLVVDAQEVMNALPPKPRVT